MTFRLEPFGALRLLNAAGEPVSFPEKGLLTLCYSALLRAATIIRLSGELVARRSTGAEPKAK